MTDATDRNAQSTDSNNPFAVSSLFQGSLSKDHQLTPPPSWFRVEGDTLVCGPKVVLPKICILTGSDADLVHEWRGVRPSFYFPWNWRKTRCLVFFWVERKRWEKHRRLKRFTELLSFGLLFAAAAGVMMSEEAVRHMLALKLTVVPAFGILQGLASRLGNPVRYISQDHSVFRLGGFGPDAMKRLIELQPRDLP